MLQVGENGYFPEEFSVLTADEAVDGGSRWVIICRAVGSRIPSTFWKVWVRGGDGFQVAEDGSSQEPYRWQCELFRTPLDRVGLYGFVVWRRCLDNMYSRNLDRWKYLRRLHFEKFPSQVDLSPLTQRSKNLRVG